MRYHVYDMNMMRVHDIMMMPMLRLTNDILRYAVCAMLIARLSFRGVFGLTNDDADADDFASAFVLSGLHIPHPPILYYCVSVMIIAPVGLAERAWLSASLCAHNTIHTANIPEKRAHAYTMINNTAHVLRQSGCRLSRARGHDDDMGGGCGLFLGAPFVRIMYPATTPEHHSIPFSLSQSPVAHTHTRAFSAWLTAGTHRTHRFVALPVETPTHSDACAICKRARRCANLRLGLSGGMCVRFGRTHAFYCVQSDTHVRVCN